MKNPKTGRGPLGDVWALGVVMLYLRRRLPIPDTSTDWQIWAVASRISPGAAGDTEKMMAWVERVAAERARLGLDQMDRVVRRMTEQEPARRCTIHEAVVW